MNISAAFHEWISRGSAMSPMILVTPCPRTPARRLWKPVRPKHRRRKCPRKRFVWYSGKSGRCLWKSIFTPKSCMHVIRAAIQWVIGSTICLCMVRAYPGVRIAFPSKREVRDVVLSKSTEGGSRVVLVQVGGRVLVLFRRVMVYANAKYRPPFHALYA